MCRVHRLAIACAAAGLLGAVVPAKARPAGGVVVSAAVSLTDVLTPIAAGFERATGTGVSLNFGASNTLARQVLDGAPVDLIVSADEAQMDRVDRAGRLVPGSRVDLLSNQLAIAVAKGERGRMTSPADLSKPGIRRIAIGDPAAVPAGVYAKQYLESQRLWTAIQGRIVPSVNVRAALAAVESGNADAAIVYVTDVRPGARAEIAVAIPREQGPRIVYPMALVQRAGAPPAARDFYRYLMSNAARDVFAQAGFMPLFPAGERPRRERGAGGERPKAAAERERVGVGPHAQ